MDKSSLPEGQAHKRIDKSYKGGSDYLMQLAEEEGWSPGLSDARILDHADPTAVTISLVNGQPVGGIAVMKHGDRSSFVGLFLVDRKWRGRGIGRALWDCATEPLGTSLVGLDAVPELEDWYRRFGFLRDQRTLKLSATASSIPEISASKETVREFGPDDLASIVALDRLDGFAWRARYLRAWMTDGLVRTAIATSEDGMTLTGYASLRPTHSGWRLGPVRAENPQIASSLLFQIFRDTQLAQGLGATVTVHVSESNSQACNFFENLGFEEFGETVRMYRGNLVHSLSQATFGIMGPELG